MSLLNRILRKLILVLLALVALAPFMVVHIDVTVFPEQPPTPTTTSVVGHSKLEDDAATAAAVKQQQEQQQQGVGVRVDETVRHKKSKRPAAAAVTEKGDRKVADVIPVVDSSRKTSWSENLREADWGESRNCSSPEFDPERLVWPLGGCSTPSGISQSQRRRSCGVCGQSPFALHVQELAQQVEQKSKQTCQNELVVFGAAFGKQKRIKGISIPTHPCHFMFILDESLLEDEELAKLHPHQTLDALSGTFDDPPNLRQVVGVRKADLPYRNNRRNIKLFKLSPHLLFPWAGRILWMDAKLTHFISIQHKSLQRYYQQTVEQRRKVCGAVVALPRSKGAVGEAAVKAHMEPTFVLHTNRLLDEFAVRKSVSDSEFAIRDQVRVYLEQVSNITTSATTPTIDDTATLFNSKKGRWNTTVKSVPLDMALIDTALLAWDFRPTHCPSFLANFLCTWLSEIHCYSDRDQVSFSFAFYETMQAMATTTQQQTTPQVIEYDRRIVFADPVSHQQPLMHFVRTKCHWYYGKANLYKCGPEAYRGY